jgi:hypothetical protein
VTPAGHPALAPTPPEQVTSGARLRRLANWVNLSTPLGLALARAGGARLRPGPMLLHLAEGYRWRFPTGSAFTVGDVVLTRYRFEDLLARHPAMLQHEEAHSRQWMACLGLPFLPLYVASMGWSWLRTGDRAARSVFERRAGLAEGGYRDVPVRPVGQALAEATRAVRAALTGRRSADTGAEVGRRRSPGGER